MGWEGAKKLHSGSDVSECVKGREEARGQVGRGMAFRDGIGWVGFAGTSEEGLGEGQVCLDRGVKGVAYATSRGQGTCTPDLEAYKDTCWWNKVDVSHLMLSQKSHNLRCMDNAYAERRYWSRKPPALK